MFGKGKFAMTLALVASFAILFAGVAFGDSVDAEEDAVVGADATFNVTFKIGDEEKVVAAVAGEDGYTVTVGTPEEIGMTVPEGKKFIGWMNEDTPVELGTVLNEETVLTADLEALPAFNITFVGDDGTVIGKMVCFEGTTPAAPEAPVKEGMTFIGWKAGEKMLTAIPAVTADATYTAVYEVNMYTVTFMDGEETIKTVEIEHGKFVTLGDVPAGFDWDFDFTAPITGDVTIKVKETVEPVPDEPADDSSINAMLAVLAIAIAVGLFVAVWHIKKEKD